MKTKFFNRILTLCAAIGPIKLVTSINDTQGKKTQDAGSCDQSMLNDEICRLSPNPINLVSAKHLILWGHYSSS